MKRLMLWTMVGWTWVLVPPAWAQIGAGSSRIPVTDWIVELFNVATNVWVPALCLFMLIAGVGNYFFNIIRIGQFFTKLVIGIGALGLGVTFFASIAGGNVAVALLLR
jgi:hypothetical protein